MQTLRLASGLLLFAVALGAVADINDTPTERRLSIPSASVSVIIPREDWTLGVEQRRPGDTAVYYMLSSKTRDLVFSVYIDKTDACKTAEACLDAALKNVSYRDAQNLERDEQGPFRLAKFHIDNPKGTPIKQAHVLASAYVDGVWIDVHISKAGKERPEFAPLVEFLKVVRVK